MEEIQKIKNNYQMGFITAQEFLTELSDFLFRIGSNSELEDVVNETLRPLANFIVNDIINAAGSAKKRIKDFNMK